MNTIFPEHLYTKVPLSDNREVLYNIVTSTINATEENKIGRYALLRDLNLIEFKNDSVKTEFNKIIDNKDFGELERFYKTGVSSKEIDESKKLDVFEKMWENLVGLIDIPIPADKNMGVYMVKSVNSPVKCGDPKRDVIFEGRRVPSESLSSWKANYSKIKNETAHTRRSFPNFILQAHLILWRGSQLENLELPEHMKKGHMKVLVGCPCVRIFPSGSIQINGTRTKKDIQEICNFLDEVFWKSYTQIISIPNVNTDMAYFNDFDGKISAWTEAIVIMKRNLSTEELQNLENERNRSKNTITHNKYHDTYSMSKKVTDPGSFIKTLLIEDFNRLMTS